MRPLHRKLFRDLLQMRSQALAIAAIIACGMAALICMATTYRGLLRSRDGYYLRQGMPELFAPVKKAPRALAHELERLPGVRRLRPRIVFDVTIDIPELSEPCSGRVLSLPDRERRIVGDIHIVRGRWFQGDGTRQVIVADAFARQHGLAPGDRLRVIMNNRKEALRIVATALAPEYVYMIRGGGEVLPDPVHFAVLWFSDSFAESVFDYRDAANEFVAQLERDAAVTEEKLAKARLEAEKTLVDLRQIELRAARLQTAILKKSAHDVAWEEAANAEAIAAIEAELIVLRDHLQRTRVEAPAPGTVLRRFEESETVLAAGAPILEIGDVTRLEAEVDYLSGDAARMKKGMAAEIFGRALADDVIPARVARIYPSAFTKISSLGVEQQRVKVIVVFDPGTSGLRDLYRVDVRVILRKRDRVTLVPESALFRHEGSWCVYRVEDGIARLRTVRTGLEDGRQREILEGLRPGDQIIVFPGSEIADGTRVVKRQ